MTQVPSKSKILGCFNIFTTAGNKAEDCKSRYKTKKNVNKVINFKPLERQYHLTYLVHTVSPRWVVESKAVCQKRYTPKG